MPEHPAAFVIVGMTACFGSAARAPLAVMVMVAEMTGGFSMLPGRILAVALAHLVVRHWDRAEAQRQPADN